MYHIIVNPASKSGKGNKIWDEVEKAFKDASVEYQVHFTKAEGDAECLAKKLTSNIDDSVNLVVLGGDGTLDEVVNGIVEYEKVRVGYIPTGSSNDFARDVKLTREPKEAVRIILEGKNVKSMDIGKVTYEIVKVAGKKESTGTAETIGTAETTGAAETIGAAETTGAVNERVKEKITRKFVVSSGIGFDAAVCEEVGRSKLKKVFNKLRLGKLVYLGVAIRNLMGGDSSPCKIYVDDKAPVLLPKFLFIACMVHKYEGGGFMFCPDADYSDDVLDVCAVGALTRRRCFRILPTAFSGKHVKFDGINMYKAKKITIETDIPLYLHTDGEVCGKTSKAIFESLPGRLNLFCE